MTGAPFLDTLLREGRARYGCLVSAPLTGYRTLELSAEPDQTVRWDPAELGEPPLIRPLIVAVERITHTFGPDDGVAPAWRGRPLEIPEGARLALMGYLKTIESLNYLLELRRDETLAAGSFRVAPCEENGFYFSLRAADDLYQFLQNPCGRARHRRSVLTHAVSRCFEILAQHYGAQQAGDAEEAADWSMHRNLTALAAELDRQGLPHWDDDAFAPDETATRMYPHQPPAEESDG